MTSLAALPATAAEPGDPPGVAFAYEALVTLGPVEQVGATPFGKRVRIPITGGVFAGPSIRGVVMPGGEDWQLQRPDGFTAVEANYWMRTSDGVLIHVINKGLLSPGYTRTTPWFEVANGPHQWLNQTVFLGTIGAADPKDGPAVRIRVFKVT